MVFFTALEARPVVHEVLILVFVLITTPVTLMLLARAALYRDRAEGNDVGADMPAAESRSARSDVGDTDQTGL
jgi:multicomponent K+:H+ antiporter subunit G